MLEKVSSEKEKVTLELESMNLKLKSVNQDLQKTSLSLHTSSWKTYYESLSQNLEDLKKDLLEKNASSQESKDPLRIEVDLLQQQFSELRNSFLTLVNPTDGPLSSLVSTFLPSLMKIYLPKVLDIYFAESLVPAINKLITTHILNLLSESDDHRQRLEIPNDLPRTYDMMVLRFQTLKLEIEDKLKKTIAEKIESAGIGSEQSVIDKEDDQFSMSMLSQNQQTVSNDIKDIILRSQALENTV